MNDLFTRCPSCGYRAEAASQIGRRGTERVRPHAGAVSLCIACGLFALFEDDFVGLRLRPPTTVEQTELDGDETLQEIRAAWEQTRRMHPTGWPGQP